MKTSKNILLHFHKKIIIDSPTGENYRGLAICSKKDNYNKKLGVKIALGRCGFYG